MARSPRRAGGQALRVLVRGVFEDTASEATVRAAAFGKAVVAFRLLFGNGDTVTGDVIVGAYEAVGAVDGMETYDITLESTGPVQLLSA